MALSGTLETFSLPDVLRLLSSTKKTGLLALDGDRGRGRVWVRDGAIVAADADRAVEDAVEGVAFELLRFVDARFDFDSGAEPPAEREPRTVDEVLSEAEARLVEWREIETVVPSLDVWVHMVAELDDERTIAPTEWRVLAQVGTGASGHALAERLEQGEYDVCRQLRDLVEGGLVELTEAPTEAVVEAPVTTFATVEEPTFVEPALDPDAVSSLGTDLASFVAVGTVEEPYTVAAPVTVEEPVVEPEATYEPETSEAETTFEPDTAEAESFEPDTEPEDDDDFASQLSQLSPKAAAAVEATWGGDEQAAADEPAADEPVETIEPVAEVEPVEPVGADEPASGSDEIDQNLLLRFLSSTKN
ncbi:MAG TPA: DUF4388 domain-containing protein [Acidimicrobiales bacterium]|nr:DUF4388 domain-containing protein [Acidimicrobiales bacterium]